METGTDPELTTRAEPHSPDQGRRPRYHGRIYVGLLIFVVVLGLPMLGVPSVRLLLRSRIAALRSAFLGERAPQVLATVRVGENREPFPHEYEHPQTSASYLAQFAVSEPRRPFVINDQGGLVRPEPRAPRLKGAEGGVSSPAGSRAETQPPPQPTAAAPAQGQGAPDAGGQPVYRKGQSEQEAYDFLLASNQALAGLVKGSDPTLKFQDWGAASMGENTYYVMVTFAQTADNMTRQYIWSVKVSTKEVTPLSSYARSISKERPSSGNQSFTRIQCADTGFDISDRSRSASTLH